MILDDQDKDKPEEGSAPPPPPEGGGEAAPSAEKPEGGAPEGGAPNEEPKPAVSPIIALLQNKIVWAVCGVLIIGIAAFLLWPAHEGDLKPVERKSSVDIHYDSFYYYELPNITINVFGGPRDPMYLKTTIFLKVDNPKLKEYLDQMKPAIEDRVMSFLRGLRYDDLQGSEGPERVRNELTLRLNQLVHPVKIHEIIVTNFLVQ